MNLSIDELATSIRDIHARDPEGAHAAIESFLMQELGRLGMEERLEIMGRLQGLFSAGFMAPVPGLGNGLLDRLVPLLLGRNISSEMDTQEILDRLSHSLGTVFTTLNELIALINSMLGGGTQGDETIRHIIGTSLEGRGEVQSIEQYLGQIKSAFLAAQKSSQEAARTIAGYILAELDPKSMDQGGSAFRIGPMKKAESFELFEEKYKRVKKWFDSERFALDFLRQFEKNCQKSFT